MKEPQFPDAVRTYNPTFLKTLLNPDASENYKPTF